MKNTALLLTCFVMALPLNAAASSVGSDWPTVFADIGKAFDATGYKGQSAIGDLLDSFFEPITMTSRIIFVDGACGSDLWTGRLRACAPPHGPKRTIQAAVNASAAGDIIIVLPAVYFENIVIQKADLLIIGILPEQTIIDGGGIARVITIANAYVSIFGITVQNGAASSGSLPIGGGILVDNSTLVMVKSIIQDNVAQASGGGLFILNGDIILQSCQILRNRAIGGPTAGGGGIQGGGIASSMTDCLFEGNEIVLLGDGAAISGFSGPITRCIINDNHIAFEAEANGGGGVSGCSGPIVGCTISNNSVEFGDGGGASACTGPITDCIITGNRAFSGIGDVVGVSGGGLANCSGPITNCLIAGNVSENSDDAGVGSQGGGLANCDGAIVNCTVANNRAIENAFGSSGGGLHDCNGPVANCIVWGNEAVIDAQAAASSTPNYSDIQDFAGGGIGNIAGDPLFVNTDTDLRLRPGSPCIDAGDNAAVPPGTVADLAGNPRFFDDPPTVDTGKGTPPIVDVGAYEHSSVCGDSAHPYPPMDFNHDCIVDFADLAMFCAHWQECTL